MSIGDYKCVEGDASYNNGQLQLVDKVNIVKLPDYGDKTAMTYIEGANEQTDFLGEVYYKWIKLVIMGPIQAGTPAIFNSALCNYTGGTSISRPVETSANLKMYNGCVVLENGTSNIVKCINRYSGSGNNIPITSSAHYKMFIKEK